MVFQIVKLANILPYVWWNVIIKHQKKCLDAFFGILKKTNWDQRHITVVVYVKEN